MINNIIDFLLSYLLLYKYITLFGVSYLAALLIPLPSNTTLLTSAVFASQGYLVIYVVFLVAFLANVLGDITGFLLSRKYGKKVLMKTPLHKIFISEKYKSAEKKFTENAAIAIFTTRFFGGIGPLVNIVSGFSENISFKKFLLYGIPGEFVYVSFFTISGYYIGDTWFDIILSINFFWIFAGVVTVVLIIILMYKIFYVQEKENFS